MASISSAFGDDASSTGAEPRSAGLLQPTVSLPAGVTLLYATAQADRFDGTSHETAVSYVNAPSAVYAYLTGGGSPVGWAVGDTYVEITDLVGSRFNDYLSGNGKNNNIYGGDGDDTMYGFAPKGATTHLYGENGDDTLVGGSGIDIMDGGVGENTISYYISTTGVTVSLADPSKNAGDAAGDVYINMQDIIGTKQDDVIIGGSTGELNQLQGEEGNDVIWGGTGYNVLIGGSGADHLHGAGTGNEIDYETAESGLTASMVDPSINTGDAAGDTYDNLSNNADLAGSPFDDVLIGDSHNNVILGDPDPTKYGFKAGDDKLFGGAGDDILDGGGGADQLDGGTGTDFASYAWALAGVTASLGDPRSNTGEAAGDTYVNIEGVIGSQYNDVISGSAGSDILFGKAGDDVLIGNGATSGGGDLLVGGAGADKLIGGAGFDYASYGDAVGVVASLVDPGKNTGEAKGDTYVSIDGLIGSAFNDVLTGDANLNVIQGGAGDDVIYGGGGADLLVGGAGDDIIIAGPGASTLNGGDGADTFRFLAVGDSVSTQQIAPTYIQDFQAGVDKIDVSAFSPTNTAIVQENGFYTLQATAPGGMLSVRSANAFTMADVIVSANSSTTNWTTGTAAADRMVGDDGANVLVGGAGADTLTGGGGADTFLYNPGDSVSGARDTITDFETGVDRLDLSRTDPTTVSLVRQGANTVVFDQGLTGPQTEINVSGVIQGSDLVLSAPGTAARGIDYVGQDNQSDHLVGTAGPDNLFGLSGDDILEGGAGNDQIFGDAGADALYGGAGSDHFSYRGVSDSNATTGYDIVGDFVSGTDKIDLYYLNGLQTVALSRLSNGGTIMFAATNGGQVQVGFTGAVQGSDIINPYGTSSSFGYDLVGMAGSEILTGSSGNDHIFGLAGNDRLEGGDGDDFLYGDLGADVLVGGAGADHFSYRQVSDTNTTDGFDVITDFQSGVDKIDFAYLNGLQSLTLAHSNGATFVFAATTAGQLQLGLTSAVAGTDLVNPFGISAAFGYDFLGEAANDLFVGSNGDDRIFGLGGDDVLAGGLGNDQISGDAGADILTGGGGKDVFLYRSLGDSSASAQDRITDFQSGQDKIDFHYLRGGPADKYAVTVQGSDTVVTFDLNGDGSNELSILLTGVTNVQASDILF